MYKMIEPIIEENNNKEYFNMDITGVLFLDRENRIKNINAEGERICGIKRSKVLGCKAEDVFVQFGSTFLKLFFNEKRQEVNHATLRVKVNGQSIYLHVNTLRIMENNGENNGSVLILQDISAIKATLKQIQTTKMLLSLGELAAGVAHHVRTPLTTINGYLQLMLKRVENDKYTVKREVLEGLLDEVSYINSVVKELVMFAKPAISKRPGIDVEQILNESLLLTFRNIGMEGIKIERQFVKGLPTINGDANFLQQTFINIFQNALEAMHTGGVLKTKIWRNVDINMIVVAIEDTGGGIDKEILPRVFEPFYTTKIDRMGLGLPIAYRIIAEHGGFINLSLTARGTKVHIYLPIINQEANKVAFMQQQVLNLQ